mmetsp:Transcript_28636/g.81897  ORF Transcript_28636/g.81897 Transcript_28636/m.81897 type:complete len:92 (+) Transcript_28636:1087-1362(+)
MRNNTFVVYVVTDVVPVSPTPESLRDSASRAFIAASKADSRIEDSTSVTKKESKSVSTTGGKTTVPSTVITATIMLQNITQQHGVWLTLWP